MNQVLIFEYRVIDSAGLAAEELEGALNALTEEGFAFAGVVNSKIILARPVGVANVKVAGPLVAPVALRPA